MTIERPFLTDSAMLFIINNMADENNVKDEGSCHLCMYMSTDFLSLTFVLTKLDRKNLMMKMTGILVRPQVFV